MSQQIKPATENFLRLSLETRKTLSEWKFDVALLLASAICFGIFAQRSFNQDKSSGIGGPIALMTQGTAERKASGSHLFVDIGPNSNLFNLDAVWVGKDNNITIKLADDSIIKLAEKTLLIIKRPFKHQSGQSSVEEGIKVLKGQVETTDGRTLMPETELLAPIEPDEPSKQEQIVPIQLYPNDNSVIYMRPVKDIPLTFAWPNSLTGYIAVQNRATGHRIYAEIQNSRHFAAKLDQPGPYFWQITNSERRSMLGPYTFEIKHLDEAAAKQLLKMGPSATTEVYW